MALDEASAEAVWLRGFVLELGFSGSLGPSRDVMITEDNTACIAMAVDPVISESTKHIAVRYYAVRDRIEEKLISVVHCPSTEMVADILTKPLRRQLFNTHRLTILGRVSG